MSQDAHKTTFDALVPELSTWNDGAGIDIDSWLACIGTYEHAVAYGRLFWPEFTLHEDCVFFAGFSVDSFRGFMEQTAGNKKAVEAVMNHRHILDLFPNVTPEPSLALVVHLGRLLKEIWASKLRRDFPTRNVVVSFPEDGNADLVDFEITFFQEHAAPG
jgi:hypothetical protein